ncbi:hypothetical protein FE782_14745 [Paenibacillus antri]|uniref:YdbS-like PH domain-containing protein n=1 Tax=Paenibacillus antri TaxID=2582848 RepID=A0A5R9G4T0_9BACL|nr:PH domain-containing protein [Paenibacillus antri]TLS51372.1 hypothetical protein FE782_14745 [Paenibacillus antri]
MKRIDPRAVQARRTEGWIASAADLTGLVILWALTARFDWPIWIPAAAAALSVLFVGIELIAMPKLLYRTWRYDVTEKEIELQHGLWVKKRSSIPMSRIQHVDSKQGPIQKRYGLSTVTFATAAGSHRIPALSEEEADRVRRQIAEWARVAEHEER